MTICRVLPSQRTRRDVLRQAAALAAAATVAPAFAQSGSTPMKLIVGYPAGGLVDSIARLLSDRLGQELRRTVVVDNRPGAGARMAATQFRRMPAEGEYLMLTTDSIMIHSAQVFTNLGYDPFQHFTPVSVVSTFPYCIATGPEPKMDTLQQYADWLRKNPTKGSFGHPGSGSAPHFFGLVLSEKIGVPITPVPYQGGNPMLAALAGGQVTSGVNAVAADMLEFHRSGRTKILAVTGDARLAQLPDVPTFAELDYPSVPRGWSAVYLPQGAAQPVVRQVNSALQAVLAQPEVKARLVSFGMETSGGGPEVLAALMRKDFETWGPIIRKSGFKLDS